MGTVSDKLTYLNGTKTKLKDVINLTEANITSETTFRNYAKTLYDGYINVLKDKGTLLDNMPKETSTGYITNAADLPVYESKMSKLSTQAGTPTPDNPVEVETVKGYRNLFDINSPTSYYPQNSLSYEIENNSLTMEATGTTGAQSITYTIDGFDDTKNYTLSFKAKKLVAGTGNFARIQITIYGSNDGSNFTSLRVVSENSPVVNQEYSLNYTVSGYKYYKFIIYNDVSQPVQLGEKTQYYDILFTDGKEKPYIPYGSNYVLKKVVGFNLWDEEWELGTINTTTGENTPNNNNIRSKNYIEIFENKTCYVKAGSSNSIWLAIETYDKNKNFISNLGGISNGGNFTPPNNCKYIRFYVSGVYGTTYNNDICINVSDTQLNGTYESYQERIVPIPLNNNEIAGIRNYKDELIVDKNGHCWLNKKIGKVVLDGSEDGWGKNGATTQTNAYTNSSVFINRLARGKAMCNYLTPIDLTSGTGIFSGLGLNFCFESSDFDTLEKFKAWLSTHNTIVYYVLAEPELIDLNYNVDLSLFKGVNNISNSEDMDMEIKYIKDTYE